MQRSQFGEQALALAEQVHFHLSTVPLARAPLNESSCLAACNERHYAMRLGLQALRKLTDMREVTSGIPLDVKEHQILKRRDAMRSSSSLGKPLESAHLVAKLRQPLECHLAQHYLAASHDGSFITLEIIYHVMTYLR